MGRIGRDPLAGPGALHVVPVEHFSSFDVVLQIWVFPNARDLKPSYDQQAFDRSAERNNLLTVVSPDGAEGVEIHQNAWFNLGSWDAGHTQSYALHGYDQGVYAFVLEGSVTIDGRTLGRRDGLGAWNTSSIDITASEDARILLMEVPMHW